MPEPRRVLLVEDHVDSREMLEEFLSEQGYTVETAVNGLEALERLRREPPPGVMLLDLMMPVMTGWELMERLEEEPTLHRIPVIVVSGAGATRPVPSGILASIPKPLDLQLLMETLAQVWPRPRRTASTGR
ncbi:Response regulator receiver domain-containing protein [Stigmatella aurantiaca]|uniref:Response regulator receiver domain-containing protein n=1 Tax=Stigmatella aurantiaca TaxID=41 RepID=A0A1H7Y0S0_STIAU|nr:response regulator [Stigmatella aurantiaca]SEM39786.1 Response regulator receiver domain-containing protein [Stigmatella aurantiaca]